MSNVSLLALAKADIKAAEMCVDHKDKLLLIYKKRVLPVTES